MTMPLQVALVAASETNTELRSPLMGRFTATVAIGAIVQGGSQLGLLRQLRNAYPVVVPEGVAGRVVAFVRPGYDACYGECVVTLAPSKAPAPRSPRKTSRAPHRSRSPRRSTASSTSGLRPTPRPS